jgi:hypothetical protein
VLRKSKAVRMLAPGHEQNMRVARQLPHDLGTANKVPNSKNVLAIEQHSIRHDGLPSRINTPVLSTSKGPEGVRRTEKLGLGGPPSNDRERVGCRRNSGNISAAIC